MKRILWFLGILSVSGSTERRLSRHKRLAVFPEGATWSLAMCTTFRMLNVEYRGHWVEAFNAGFSYDLPNNASVYKYFLFSHDESARRSRRDLYQNIENVVETLGFNGKSCMLRSLCEASRKFVRTGKTVLEEVIRLIFSFPLHNVGHGEPRDHLEYQEAFTNGSDTSLNCQNEFPDCPFSLLDMAMHGQINT